MVVLRVTITRTISLEMKPMAEREIKATTSGWRLWAIGAATLSMGCAAALFFLKRWAESRAETDEVYEAWWRHRDQVRDNGHGRSSSTGRTDNPQLFV
jgi:hypothetical protein